MTTQPPPRDSGMTGHAQSLVLPHDEYNQQLVANVHPSDWINPEPTGRYNIVVIGAGTAGLITAVVAASLGAKVALIEKHLMGGDCLNVGCVPSKGVIRAARAWADLRRATDFGLHVPPGVTYDFGAVMARMRKLRARISQNDSVQRYAKLGVDVYIGSGRFLDPKTIKWKAVGHSHPDVREGRRLHGRTGIGPSDTGAPRDRISHQRDRIFIDRAAATSRRDRSRPHRL